MKHWVIGVTILLFTTPTLAQQIPAQALTQIQAVGRWTVEYDEAECVLSREWSTGDERGLLTISVWPLHSTSWLRVGTEGESGRRRDSGDAVMLIDGERIPGTLHYNIYATGSHRVREFMLDLDRHRLGSVENSIRFWTRRHGDLNLQLGNFPAAWQAVNRCISDLYAELGISEAEIAQVAVKPEGNIFSFVRLPRGVSALNFALVYWVAADGAVDNCRLLQPSGVADFDASLCSELMEEARMRPARDINGQPIRAPRYENVRIRTQTFTTTSPL